MVPLLVLMPALGQPAGGHRRCASRVRSPRPRWSLAVVLLARAAADARLVSPGGAAPLARAVRAQRAADHARHRPIITELAGLSLALGAFLAGMLISETEYRYQVEEDIKPFRDVLLGLFFVTVGMLLDLARGGGSSSGWWRRCSRAAGAAKFALIAGAVARVRRPAGDGAARRRSRSRRAASSASCCWRSRRRRRRCRADAAAGRCSPAMILSMLATPFLIAAQRPDRAALRALGVDAALPRAAPRRGAVASRPSAT